ncbi:hypothetical protein BH20VER2_BH20VER2_05300 [soil metagenome]
MISLCCRALLGVALLFSFAGCGVITSRPPERAQFTTAQTGSNLGRRVPARSTAREQRTRDRQKKQTRETAQPAREVVDPDFMPRGGFR